MALVLRPSLFWDVNITNVDLDKYKVHIIERIMLRGRLDEFRAMMQHYGRETVRQVMLNARWLDKVTLAFCSTIFDVPKTEFRCYKLAQLNPEHWDY